MSDLDPNTSFTVKEMILMVMGKLDQMDGKLDEKASAADVREYGLRITALEHAQISRKAIGGLVAALVTLVPACSLLLNWLNLL